MLRRTIVGLVVPLFVLAAIGCGGDSGTDAPKVQNPTLKVKPVGDGKNPDQGGPKIKSD